MIGRGWIDPRRLSSARATDKDREMRSSKQTVIYLDSSDYSTLTRPRLEPAQNQQLAALRALKKRKDVMFVYSGAHIAEMSPLEEQYASAGVARTALMVELCGRTTMISYDRLMKAELLRLVERDPAPVDVLDTNGGWFPDMGSLMSPLDELDIPGIVQEEVDKHQMNRKARRILQKSMSKQGGFRSNFEKTTGEMLDFTELLKKVPMRKRDAAVLKRYVLGTATRAQADQAFLESLRDPTFMSQWFIHNHHQLGAVVEWIRKPAQQIIASCQQTLDDLNDQLAQLSKSEHAEAMRSVRGERWTKLKKQGMLDIVNHLLESVLPEASKCEDASLIERYCPGLFVCVNAFYTSLHKSLGENGRKPKASDFVDLIHALYIPYVSYFRADRYMCGILQPLAEACGTEVVASPAAIIESLEEGAHQAV
ncbi:hypothetical protein IPC1077_07995 [Pseudomonas aeruginosa]|nr:hypothetical protein T223_22960 [Pseudomonas aeruginosa LES431]AHK85368.1 hypothetical protein T227_22910 [Pseudomonas aeruginosa LESlike5]AHK97243.1 hypothetical protein T222_23290 [Pseudomonas aeruginosa LES400]AHL03209.1 hypothetical protein T224_22890 [Pseudomonas aeruginosa LESB65]AHL09130.1 hypothetical protein T225_22790 [Pseudomonas aeruginosa LESlike1]AHL15085.1 hypothetical protein T226_22845 [Pseudomonas aeruginosa LESlike4]KSH97893.2 hypothetical protein AO979_09135 [Pseudomona